MICRVSVIPSRDPMFHRNEIDLGVGRSASDDLMMDAMGWIFIVWFFIRRMNKGFGMGCDHVWRGIGG